MVPGAGPCRESAFLVDPTRGGTMSGHAHHSPAEIRAKLNHPVIDGDGHWVEYDPVFAEQMRKVGGDLAADGFLAAMNTTREALLLCVEERRGGGWRCPGSGRGRPATPSTAPPRCCRTCCT